MTPSSFPALSILWEAAIYLVQRRRVLAEALILPFLGLIAISVVGDRLPQTFVWNLVAAALSLPFYALFGIACHRVILLGESSLPNRWGVFWTGRETRFLGWLVYLALVLAAISIPISIISLLVPDTFLGINASWGPKYLAYFVGAYFEGRLSMVLPATAIGRISSLPDSWGLTAGNGLHIALALIIPVIVFDGLITALFFVFDDITSILVRTTYVIAIFLLFAVEIGVISVAYSKLAYVSDDGNAA